MLEHLGRGSATITELAEPFGISLTGMKKHVWLLEDTGLVTTEKVGRARRCSLGPRRLEDVHERIELYQPTGSTLTQDPDRWTPCSARGFPCATVHADHGDHRTMHGEVRRGHQSAHRRRSRRAGLPGHRSA